MFLRVIRPLVDSRGQNGLAFWIFAFNFSKDKYFLNFIECGRMILEKIVSNNTGPISTPTKIQNSTFSGIICIGSFGNIHLKRVEDGGSLNICGTLLNYFVWLCVLHQENNNNQQRLDLAWEQ